GRHSVLHQRAERKRGWLPVRGPLAQACPPRCMPYDVPSSLPADDECDGYATFPIIGNREGEGCRNHARPVPISYCSRYQATYLPTPIETDVLGLNPT